MTTNQTNSKKTQNQTKQIPETKITMLPRSTKPYTYISAYGPKTRVQMSFEGNGRTKQSFKDECDINIIMSRYMQTGVLDHVNQRLPQFLDMEEIDYQGAMLVVAESKSLFAELPAAIREKFQNDPGRFLDFVQDPDNRDEMHEMGLLRPDYMPEAQTQAPPAAAQPEPSSPEPEAKKLDK